MKKKNRISLFLIGVFFSGPLVHIANSASPDPLRGNNGKILRFGVNVSEMGNMDPHFAAGSQDRALADMVFNGLLRYQPGNAPNIEPDLAAYVPGFDMIGGRQVWTVKLRKGDPVSSRPPNGCLRVDRRGCGLFPSKVCSA